MNNDIAIFIPSYKNRHDELFNYIIDGNFNDYQIFIVLSEDDVHLSEYYQYKFPKNVKLLETDRKTIGSKRQYIIDFAINHRIEYVVQIDDDVKNFGYKITPESKRTTSNTYKALKIPLVEVIDKTVNCLKSTGYAFVSPSIQYKLGFSCPGNVFINGNINFGQIVSMNSYILKEIGFKYETSKYFHEDIDLVFQLIINGKTCASLGDYAFNVINDSKKFDKSTLLDDSINTLDMLRINLYLKYGDGITFTIGGHGELRMNIRLKKYWNIKEIPIKHDEYHDKLRELCKNKDIQAIKQLVKNKHLSESIRKKFSETRKGRSAWNKGIECSDVQKKKQSQQMKGRHLWNNGIITIMSRECPEGFVKGRLNYARNRKVQSNTKH